MQSRSRSRSPKQCGEVQIAKCVDSAMFAEHAKSLILSCCPSGCLKIDEAALRSFHARISGKQPSTSGKRTADCLSIVLDYDLTISGGDAAEGHHLLGKA